VIDLNDGKVITIGLIGKVCVDFPGLASFARFASPWLSGLGFVRAILAGLDGEPGFVRAILAGSDGEPGFVRAISLSRRVTRFAPRPIAPCLPPHPIVFPISVDIPVLRSLIVAHPERCRDDPYRYYSNSWGFCDERARKNRNHPPGAASTAMALLKGIPLRVDTVQSAPGRVSVDRDRASRKKAPARSYALAPSVSPTQKRATTYPPWNLVGVRWEFRVRYPGRAYGDPGLRGCERMDSK